MINNNFTSEAYLINLSNTLGTTGMNYLTLKDGEIMREAITDLKSESVIEELENLKSKMLNRKDEWGKYPVCKHCIEFIDERVLELKGE